MYKSRVIACLYVILTLCACTTESSFGDPFIADIGDTQSVLLDKYSQIKQSDDQEELKLYCLTSSGYKLVLPNDQVAFYDAVPYDSVYVSNTLVFSQIHDCYQHHDIVFHFDKNKRVSFVAISFEDEIQSGMESAILKKYPEEIVRTMSHIVVKNQKGQYVYEFRKNGLSKCNYTFIKMDKKSALEYVEKINDGSLKFEHTGLIDIGSELFDMVMDEL